MGTIELVGKGKCAYLWVGEWDADGGDFKKIITVSGQNRLRASAKEILEKVPERKRR